MTGVLSLWTGTTAFRMRRSTMILATLSANLASRSFLHTHFVTDGLGAVLAKEFRWPVEYISRELDHIPRRFEKIWAYGKLVACSIQRSPHIQLDLDVCLLKALPLWFMESRLVAQSLDFPHYYESEDMRKAIRLCRYHYGPMAYNCGLMGGSDIGLVRAYAWAGMDLAEKFVGTKFNGTCSSMMIEQFQLGVFEQRTGVPVCTLFPLRPNQQLIKKLGYIHLTGRAKHTPHIQGLVEERLKREFPEAHARFIDVWGDFEESTEEPECSSGDGIPWANNL